MGRGNTTIRINSICYPTYYIKYPNEEEEEVNSNSSIEFIEEILEYLEDYDLSSERCDIWLERDQKVILTVNNTRIVIADNEWSLAIACVPDDLIDGDDLDEQSKILYLAEANKIMHYLHKCYQLHTWTSAWTSSKLETPAGKSKYKYYTDEIWKNLS